MGEINQTEKTVPLVLNSLSGATVQGAQNTCLKQKLVHPSPTGEAEKRSPRSRVGGAFCPPYPFPCLILLQQRQEASLRLLLHHHKEV